MNQEPESWEAAARSAERKWVLADHGRASINQSVIYY